jgi:hypothetical protein
MFRLWLTFFVQSDWKTRVHFLIALVEIVYQSRSPLGGRFGAKTFTKTAIGQLVMGASRGIGGDGDFFLLRFETYLILLGLICAIVFQMVFLNKGLSRFESSYIVPTFTGTFIVFVALSGGVVYNEFAEFTVVSQILFPLGVLLCVLGVFALTWNVSKPREEEMKVGFFKCFLCLRSEPQ